MYNDNMQVPLNMGWFINIESKQKRFFYLLHLINNIISVQYIKGRLGIIANASTME